MAWVGNVFTSVLTSFDFAPLEFPRDRQDKLRPRLFHQLAASPRQSQGTMSASPGLQPRRAGERRWQVRADSELSAPSSPSALSRSRFGSGKSEATLSGDVASLCGFVTALGGRS
jgi:hypothetical protein